MRREDSGGSLKPEPIAKTPVSPTHQHQLEKIGELGCAAARLAFEAPGSDFDHDHGTLRLRAPGPYHYRSFWDLMVEEYRTQAFKPA